MAEPTQQVSIPSTPSGLTDQKKKKKVKIIINAEVKPKINASSVEDTTATSDSTQEDVQLPKKGKDHFDLSKQIDTWLKNSTHCYSIDCSCGQHYDIPFGMLNDFTVKMLSKCSCGKQAIYKKSCGNKECKSFIFQKHFDLVDKGFTSNYCHQCVKKHKSEKDCR
jgi:hypothetical protein